MCLISSSPTYLLSKEIAKLINFRLRSKLKIFFFCLISSFTFNVGKNTQYISYDCGKFFLEEILGGNDIISFERR